MIKPHGDQENMSTYLIKILHILTDINSMKLTEWSKITILSILYCLYLPNCLYLPYCLYFTHFTLIYFPHYTKVCSRKY